LGNDAGNATDFGTLTFNSAGPVSIAEDSATQLAGSSTADSLSLTSGGALSDASGTSLVVTNGAIFTAVTGISLADNADTYTVGRPADLEGGAGAITVGSPGTVNFGSLMFNSSAGAVTIFEDGAGTNLTGSSTATGLSLTSAGAIIDASGTSLNVTG